MYKLPLLTATFVTTFAFLGSAAYAVTPKGLDGRVFELVTADNKPLAKRVRLTLAGAIKGVNSKLAARWTIADRIVVFIDAKKNDVCRFTRVRTSNGKLSMRGELARDPKKTWVLRERGYKEPYKAPRAKVTRKQVMSRTFTFAERRGRFLAPKLRLGQKGKVIGHKAINAARWDLLDGKVVFYNTKGKPSVVFTAIRFREGKLEMMGAFISNRRVTLVLRELGYGK